MNNNQQAVLDYIDDKDQTPLYFRHMLENESDEIKKLDFDNLVLKCLKKTSYYDSTCAESEIFETPSGKWRSVLDIWRHVLFFQPKSTIFDVMNSIYKNKKHYTGQYCYGIHRRTFKDSGGGVGPSDQNHPDEFGLTFHDWENINKE